jgi:NhaP-type Na+/H+ or K+/H+ antiporter
VLEVNALLAAFAAGATIASMSRTLAREVQAFGSPLSEAVKLATLLAFGATLDLGALLQPGWRGLVFAAVTLLLARPLALILALLGKPLPRREWLAVAWFGPKGFASLLYTLIMLQSKTPGAARMSEALCLVIVLSMVAHPSTDVAVARTFVREGARPGRGV